MDKDEIYVTKLYYEFVIIWKIFGFYYTDQNYKRNTFVFAPIFHELNSKI